MNPAGEDPAAAAASADSATGLARSSAIMSVGTALSRLSGFVRLTAAAWALGIVETRLADAYTSANTMPNIIYELALGGILSSVFVPVFVEWLDKHGREQAWELARRMLSITVVVLGGLAIVGIIFAPAIIRLYTLGITDPERRAATQELGTFFLRFFMPQIVFYGIGAVATGLLNSHRRFAAPMFAPILNNVVSIATFVTFGIVAGSSRAEAGFSPTGSERTILAIGTTLGVVAMTVALWPSLRRTGFRFHWRGSWNDAAMKRVGGLAKWMVVYVAANQVGYLIIMMLAFREQGGYTAYASAFILFQLPYAIFAVSIFTALLPALSSRWTAQDTDGFRSMLSRGLRMTGFVVIPAACGYIAIATPIVRLVLEYGVAGKASSALVAETLTFFALGLFSFAGFQLMLRAFYSMQDTRTPALINIAALGINVAVNLLAVLVLDMGVPGLALGHAAGYTFAVATAGYIMSRRLGGLDGRRITASLTRIVLGGALTALAALAVSGAVGNLVPGGGALWLAARVCLSVIGGLVVFLASAYLLRMEELGLVKSSVLTRFGR